MLNVTIQMAKASFFDRAAVRRAVERSTARRVLSKFGAYVRQRARTSIRKRKGTSPPAGPPFSHTGLLRNGILFAFDASRKSVVIGPTKLRASSRAPEVLEEGGVVIVPAAGNATRTQTYQARPYMGPAFRAELPQVDRLWQDSIK